MSKESPSEFDKSLDKVHKTFPALRYHFGAMGLFMVGGITVIDRPILGLTLMGSGVISESLAVAKHEHQKELLYHQRHPAVDETDV